MFGFLNGGALGSNPVMPRDEINLCTIALFSWPLLPSLHQSIAKAGRASTATFARSKRVKILNCVPQDQVAPLVFLCPVDLFKVPVDDQIDRPGLLCYISFYSVVARVLLFLIKSPT